MGVQEIISKNIEDIESLLPRIDEKIRNRRKRTLITTATIASIVFSFFLYKSVLVPQYEAFQKRRQIKVTDLQFEDYRSQLTSILNDNIVDPGEYSKLIVIKKILPDLEKKYEPLGVKRNFTPLEHNINRGERIYQAELTRKRKIALVDEEFNHYKNIFESILVSGVDKRERNELDPIIINLQKLAKKYISLNADENVSLTNKLEFEVNLAVSQFDLNERLEKEKNKYASLARGGISISEEKPLMQIFHRLNNLELGYTEVGLETKSLDALLGNVKKGIKIVEATKKYDKGKVDHYSGRLEQINRYVESKKYSLVHKEIRELADELKKEDFPSANTVLGKVNNFSYFKLVNVDAQYERKKIGDGYYKKKWVPPNCDSTYLSFCNKPNRSSYWVCRDNCTRPGYYKKIWVSEPQYRRVLVQEAHYKKLQIFPYNGKQIVVDNFVPMKK